MSSPGLVVFSVLNAIKYFLCYEIFFERSGGVLVPGSEHRLFSGWGGQTMNVSAIII